MSIVPDSVAAGRLVPLGPVARMREGATFVTFRPCRGAARHLGTVPARVATTDTATATADMVEVARHRR